jgi:hypothetical protein
MAHAAYEAFPEFHYSDRDWARYEKWRTEVFNRLTQEEKKELYEHERRTNIPMGPADCRIEKTRRHTMHDLTVYAMFVQTWGSTALGFGGIGGASVTSDYVCVIESDLLGQFAVYFGGRLAYRIERPNAQFGEDIAAQHMADAKTGKGRYERTN